MIGDRCRKKASDGLTSSPQHVASNFRAFWRAEGSSMTKFSSGHAMTSLSEVRSNPAGTAGRARVCVLAFLLLTRSRRASSKPVAPVIPYFCFACTLCARLGAGRDCCSSTLAQRR